MANEDIQKESPGAIRKEPPRAEVPPQAPGVNRFRRPQPVQNLAGQIALDLGVFSAFLTLMGLVAMWGFGRKLFGYAWPLAGWDWYIRASGLCMFLGPVLGSAALRFGVLGLRFHKQHPTAGGRGNAIFGIWMGLVVLIAALVVFLSLFLSLIQNFHIMGIQG